MPRSPLMRKLVLFLGLSAAAGAQVAVCPRAATLLSGRTCAFRVRLAGERPPDPPAAPDPGPYTFLPPGDWTWSVEDGVGHLDEATGVYTAPPVHDPCNVRIRASHRHIPDLGAEALLVVLPSEPFAVVEKVMGPDWLEPVSAEPPFLPPEGPSPASAREVPACPDVLPPPFDHCAGVGIPFTLRWPHLPAAEWQRLQVGAGMDLVEKDVTGNAEELQLWSGQANFTVQALRRGPGSGWRRHVQTGSIHHRGLHVLAGSACAPPGHQDGAGISARFQAPLGLAVVPRPGAARDECLVSDPGSHVLRLVSESGAVATAFGSPGRPGHQDTDQGCVQTLAGALGFGRTPAGPLFNGPTFLAMSERAFPPRAGRWTGYVADSGNHCIRLVHSSGAVRTLAGDPGRAGHRDRSYWLGRGPLFSDPRGLAEDPGDGLLYVADRGNHAIRWVDPGAWPVRAATLAGSPGQSGSVDGTGRAARFKDLRGLACPPRTEGPTSLFVVDGHAIRRILAPGGEVSTVLGRVDTPGFADILAATPPPRRRAAVREPCLRDPCGLCACNANRLLIADAGNHSLRVFDFAENTLSTLVGDPGLDEDRPGLVRDGLEPPLDPRFAALSSPRMIAIRDDTCLVTSGPCLYKLKPNASPRDSLFMVEALCDPARAHEPCPLTFEARVLDRQLTPSARVVHYTADFIEPDGTLAATLAGRADAWSATTVQGGFSQPGQGRVVLRCVTDQGVSRGVQLAVEVR